MDSIFITHLKGISPLLPNSIFKDDLVNDFTAQDAAPPKEFLTRSIEFFEDHNPTTTMTLHDILQSFDFVERSNIKQFLYQSKGFQQIFQKQMGFVG